MTLRWDTLAYHGGRKINRTVAVELLPFDDDMRGIAFRKENVPIRNNAVPVIASSGYGTQGTHNDITVNLMLSDAESDPTDILLEYRIGSSGVYRPVTRVSDAAALPAEPTSRQFKLIWHSFDDIQSNTTNVYLRAWPIDAQGMGAPRAFSSIYVNNANVSPVATDATARGDSREIEISFLIADANGDRCKWDLQYSTDSVRFMTTLKWSADTDGIAATATPKRVTLWWDSMADLPLDTIAVARIVPSDLAGEGTPATSAAFQLRNGNHPPQVTITAVTGGPGDITITYDLVEPDTGDQCDVFAFVSTDGGETYWQTAELSGDKMDQTTGDGKTMVWHSRDDFSNDFPAVSVMLIAWDGKELGNQSKCGQAFSVMNGGGETTVKTAYRLNDTRDRVSVYSLHGTKENDFAKIMYYVGDNPYFIYSENIYKNETAAYTVSFATVPQPMKPFDLAMATEVATESAIEVVEFLNNPSYRASGGVITVGALPALIAAALVLVTPSNKPAELVRVTDKAGRVSCPEFRDSEFHTEIANAYFERDLFTRHEQQKLCIEYILIGDASKSYLVNRIEYIGSKSSGNVDMGRVYQTEGDVFVPDVVLNKLVIDRNEVSFYRNDEVEVRVVAECEGREGGAKAGDVDLKVKIYRFGSDAPEYVKRTLTPLEHSDNVKKDGKLGMSWSFMKGRNKWVQSTLQEINNTVALVAIPDGVSAGDPHVSVRPSVDDAENSKLTEWCRTKPLVDPDNRNGRYDKSYPGHEYTRLLIPISRDMLNRPLVAE